MKNKIFISGLVVVILLASLSAAFAFGGQGSLQSGVSCGSGVMNRTYMQTQTMSQDFTMQCDREQNTEKLCQENETCLNEQHLYAYENRVCNLEALASYLEIDTSDMSRTEIVTAIESAVEALDSSDLSALADKMEIDTTDLTDAEILAAIEDTLLPARERLHINR
ncbi:MAG: hypothetical protein EOM51_04665 [Clostridia bacterium]|nr:hypothetical protein [Clostridia bacterium]